MEKGKKPILRGKVSNPYVISRKHVLSVVQVIEEGELSGEDLNCCTGFSLIECYDIILFFNS